MVSCVPPLHCLRPTEACTPPANLHSSCSDNDFKLHCGVLLTVGDPLHLGRVMYLAQRTSLGTRGQERLALKITNLALQDAVWVRKVLGPALLPSRPSAGG